MGRIINNGSYAHRPSDLIARYGGEEFIVILSETNIKDAEQESQVWRIVSLRKVLRPF